MEIVYLDPAVLVCVKPAGVLSTDEAGGLPELVRQELGEPGADLRTVHRLDRAVSGLMVLGALVYFIVRRRAEKRQERSA